MRKGSISIGNILTIGGAVAAIIIWNIGYIAMQIAPVKAEADENAVQLEGVSNQLAAISTKLDFILGVYGAKYSPQTQTVTEQPK